MRAPPLFSPPLHSSDSCLHGAVHLVHLRTRMTDPGQLGGDAIMNTLLGINNPGGKTPVTWYPEAPIVARDMHNMDLASGDGLTHLYYTGPVLWPFGFGLSCEYCTFRHRPLVSLLDPRKALQKPCLPVAPNPTKILISTYLALFWPQTRASPTSGPPRQQQQQRVHRSRRRRTPSCSQAV